MGMGHIGYVGLFVCKENVTEKLVIKSIVYCKLNIGLPSLYVTLKELSKQNNLFEKRTHCTMYVLYLFTVLACSLHDFAIFLQKVLKGH